MAAKSAVNKGALATTLLQSPASQWGHLRNDPAFITGNSIMTNRNNSTEGPFDDFELKYMAYKKLQDTEGTTGISSLTEKEKGRFREPSRLTARRFQGSSLVSPRKKRACSEPSMLCGPQWAMLEPLTSYAPCFLQDKKRTSSCCRPRLRTTESCWACRNSSRRR